MPDPIHDLNAAVQAVKRAATRFPLGKQLAAEKAAAQVLLDRLPVEYAIWPDDEEPDVTLRHQTRLLLTTARRLRAQGSPKDETTVREALDQLVESLGYVRTPDGIAVPF